MSLIIETFGTIENNGNETEHRLWYKVRQDPEEVHFFLVHDPDCVGDIIDHKDLEKLYSDTLYKASHCVGKNHEAPFLYKTICNNKDCGSFDEEQDGNCTQYSRHTVDICPQFLG